VTGLIRIKAKKTRDVKVGGHQRDRAKRRTIDGSREGLAIRITIVALGTDVAVFVTRVCETNDTVAVNKAIVIVTISVAIASAFRAVDVLNTAIKGRMVARDAGSTVLSRKRAFALADKANREGDAASMLVAVTLVKLVPVVVDHVVAINKRRSLGREEARKVDKQKVSFTRDDLLCEDLDLDGRAIGAVSDDVGTQKVAEETLQVDGVVEEDVIMKVLSGREGHREGEHDAEEKIVVRVDASS
jgi:hypothetical protein